MNFSYKYFFPCLFLCIICYHVFAQNIEERFSYQYVYKTTYFPDSLNGNRFETEYMELLVNDSISVFQALNKGLRDSLIREYTMRNKHYDPIRDDELIASSPFKIKHMIIASDDKLFVSDTYRILSLEGVPDIRYYFERLSVGWEISSETTIINGLNVQKANIDFGGRKWIAWFSQDIPIGKGPYKFGGLPGLIIHMYDSNNAWSFEMLHSGFVNRIIDMPNQNLLMNKKQVTNKKTFFLDRKNYYENRTDFDIAAGSIIVISESAKKEAEEWSRKWLINNNNWIELF